MFELMNYLAGLTYYINDVKKDVILSARWCKLLRNNNKLTFAIFWVKNNKIVILT